MITSEREIDDNFLSQMISDIISLLPDANRRFYMNLPKMSKKFVNNEKLQLDIIEFIMIWCDFGDILTVKTLLNNICSIFPEKPSDNVLFIFLPIFSELVTKCGTALFPDLLNFIDTFKLICGEQFIQSKLFPFLSSMLDLDKSDIQACSFSVLVHMIPEIGVDNISKLISISEKFIDSKFPVLQLSVIDSFPILIKYSSDKTGYFNKIIVKSLKDKCTRVRTHSLRIASNHTDLISNINDLIDISNDSSWKVKICLIESIGPFLKLSSEYENILLNITHDKDSIFSLKEASFHQINKYFNLFHNYNEIYRCLDLALRQKDENLVVSALPLIPKLYSKDSSLIKPMTSIISRFRASKKEYIHLAMIKYAVPFIQVTANELSIVQKWLYSGLDSEDWRVNDLALDSINGLLTGINSLDSLLNDQLFQKVCSMLTSRIFHIRCRAAIIIVSYSEKYGWDFVREKVMPVIRHIKVTSTLPILQTIIRAYIGLEALGPPKDIRDELSKEIDKVCIKDVYIINRSRS